MNPESLPNGTNERVCVSKNDECFKNDGNKLFETYCTLIFSRRTCFKNVSKFLDSGQKTNGLENCGFSRNLGS